MAKFTQFENCPGAEKKISDGIKHFNKKNNNIIKINKSQFMNFLIDYYHKNIVKKGI